MKIKFKFNQKFYVWNKGHDLLCVEIFFESFSSTKKEEKIPLF